jgi:[NiFe] hydrogenase assembly HybE family chaperone
MGKGKELKINFPQGSYKFSARQEEEVGSYLNCSLASPVHEWKSQSDAVDTAKDVMRLIMLIPLANVEDKVEDKVENSVATSCNKNENEPVDCHLTRRGFLGGGAVAG